MSDSVGSVSVEVVPDARGWSEKLRAQIRDQNVTINADADTTEAETQLDEAARTRTAKIKTDVSQLSQGASKLDQFVGNLSLLPTLAITAGAALVPLGAALGGVTAALAAPLLIAGGGLTLFGFLAAFAAKDTNEQLKAIDKLQQKLGTLTKGTKDYADTARQLKDAQEGLSPAQTQFAKSLDGIKGAFDTLLQGKTGQALLGPLSEGMDLLAKVLPGLAPVITSVSGALSTLLGDISDGVSSPGFDKFIRTFSGQVGDDIVSFGHIAGNGIKGLVGILGALDDSLSGGVLHGLERLSGNFADLGANSKHSKGFQDFIDYFHKVGPQVADTLGSVARSIGHIVEALAPLGPPVLHIIKGMADAFNSIPIPVLTALAGATAGLVAFGKLGGFKATAFGLNKFTGGKGALGGLIGGTTIVPVRVVGPVEVVGLSPTGGGGGGPGGAVLGTGEKVAAEVAVGASFAAKVARFGEFVGTFGRFIGAPAFVGTGGTETGSHRVPGGTSPNLGTQFVIPPSGNLPTKIPGSGPIKALGTAYEALRQHVADASREMDQVGPHGANAAKKAGSAIDHLGSRLNAVDGSKASQQLDLVGHAANRIPSSKTVKVNAETGQSLAQLRQVASELAALRSKTITVTTKRVAGGSVKQGFASGGYVSGPGGPTSDSIPTWLSNGEFVVDAATTRQHRQLLEQLTRGSYRAPQHAATGYAPRGPAGSTDSGGVIHTHVHLDGREIGQAITPYMDAHADANREYDRSRWEASR